MDLMAEPAMQGVNLVIRKDTALTIGSAQQYVYACKLAH